MTNAELISAQIESLNREAEQQAAYKARSIINSILANQNSIRDAEAKLAKLKEEIAISNKLLRESLASITFTPITTVDVLGPTVAGA